MLQHGIAGLLGSVKVHHFVFNFIDINTGILKEFVNLFYYEN